MRLSVFTPESSPQLLIDLAKIYQYHFAAEQLTPTALHNLIGNEQAQVYVTMFNERHLGALQVKAKDKQAKLSLLSVRDVTRRRGVAKNLIREVEKKLKNEGVLEVEMDLNEIQEKEKAGMILFMQASGYQLINNIFKKVL
jgi:ribosomal protein S18 acetylase RimI-like enzyme